MSRLILDLSMSLDGFVAGRNVGVDNPLGDHGDRLHGWMFDNATETGRRVQGEIFASAGAILMGRRTFDVGKPHWGAETFRRLPVFVLTHRVLEPVSDPGGSTFTFVTGVDRALAQARAAASGRDVVLGGGASACRPYLQAESVDELRIHLVHLLLGAGELLFELSPGRLRPLRVTRLVENLDVTHFRFVPIA
jgi:dihydrofolate reductase